MRQELLRYLATYLKGMDTNSTAAMTVFSRQFEPFTMKGDGATFNDGAEIFLIEAIASKLNIQLQFEDFALDAVDSFRQR